MMGAVEGWGCWSWAIGCQLEQRRRTGQLSFPILQLLLKIAVLRPRVLPAGEVGVLNRQLGKLWSLAERETVIQLFQLAREDSHRPVIGDDVMHREQEHVFIRVQAKERRAHQWAVGQVKRDPRRVL